MPIYTYVCKDCKEKFELMVGVNAEKTELKCVKCASNNIERIFSAFSVGNSGSSSCDLGGSCSAGSCGF
ncbi:MAG: zinc ribbon domain-containing protein [Candidatus Omnitrophica bacterium]|nr:zinc ribbon domain-containing protein [Candidatus Omnitrophota bacterium]